MFLLSSAICLAAGLPLRSIEADGRTRTYQLYVPPDLDRSHAAPLVLVLHGAGGDGAQMIATTGFNELAKKKRFLVAYPNGYGKHWNDGRNIPEWPAHKENVDDVGFFSTLIDKLIATENVDPKRVYVTGISNGGLMSHLLGCALSGKVTAIAPVVRTFTTKIALSCAPSRAVPVMMFFGTADPLVPFEGGDQKMGSVKTPTLSARQTIQRWVDIDGCSSKAEVTAMPHKNPSDPVHVDREQYSGCRQGSMAIAYIQKGAGHTWPDFDPYRSDTGNGKIGHDVNATQVIWDFFEKH